MKFFVALLCPLFTLAQRLPVSESSTYVYSKTDFGTDFFNVSHGFSESHNGSIWLQPYGNTYLKLGNTKSWEPIPSKNNSFPDLFRVVEWRGMTYYLTNKYILTYKNNRQVKKTHFKQSITIQFPIIDHNHLYFLGYSLKSHDVNVYRFDGRRVVSVKKCLSVKPILFENKGFVYLIDNLKDQLQISQLRGDTFITTYQLKTIYKVGSVLQFTNSKNMVFIDVKWRVVQLKNGNIDSRIIQLNTSNRYFSGYYSSFINNHKCLWKYEQKRLVCVANTSYGNELLNFHFSPTSNSYYCGTGTDFLRLFPHIKKFPRLFHETSFSVFSLLQDKKGMVWAGSYQGDLTRIGTQNANSEHKSTEFRFLSQGLTFGDQLIQFAESEKGIALFKNFKQTRVLKDSVVAFCGLLSTDSLLYFGCPERYGFIYTDARKITNQGVINWRHKKGKNGFQIENIVALAEDRFGNIWAGGGKAIGVFNPRTGTIKTWESERLNIPFLGARTICKDNRQTLWFGARNGALLYYDGKYENDFSVYRFKAISHPLLNSGEPLTFLHQWNDYLIIGAKDKVILFDLKIWYARKEADVRYINPMELNLTGTTEQNTIFTDSRDKSVWFSSSDMVYQWDIRKWLSLPVFYAQPTISVIKDSIPLRHHMGKTIEFEPTENSFSVTVEFQTKDNMPRYLNGALAKKGENPVFGQPNLQTTYQFTNLSSGDYVFYVRICQQDGCFTLTEFPISIHYFIWQHWWFWGLLSLIPFIFLVVYFRKRNQLERQKKQLSQLSLSSLSNQFRPHFMLNALNSIGSQMDDKPHAEKVISRLGESISILYVFTQSNEFTHSFKHEWKLIENIIEIQRLLYIPNLHVKIEQQELIPNDYKIPVGLIQIPVENALLHGLRNKTSGICALEISFLEDNDHYYMVITDNGIGRVAAQQINNFRNNGNGLKTLFAMIDIINKHVREGLQFEIIDLDEGTEVKIRLSKKLNYAKIQL